MRLTEREEQVIDAVAMGMTDKAIAWRLGISPHTVGGHIKLIRAKLGADNRVHAAVIWARLKAAAEARGTPEPIRIAR